MVGNMGDVGSADAKNVATSTSDVDRRGREY